MFINKIRLKNGYKRFYDLTIDLGKNPARIVALVGPNGCGKSSVLDGLLYHASAYEQLGQRVNREQSYHALRNISTLNFNDIEIQFTTGNFGEVRQMRQMADGTNTNTIFSFRSPYRYNSHVKISETKAVAEIKKNSYGAADAASLDAKMEDNYRRLYAVYNRYRDDNDIKPSEAKSKIIGDLNASIKACLDLEISSLGNVEGNQ